MGGSDGGAGSGKSLSSAQIEDQVDAIADSRDKAESQLGEPEHAVPTGPHWKEATGWAEPHNYRGWWVPIVLFFIIVLGFLHWTGVW